jgi:hypothetical protein
MRNVRRTIRPAALLALVLLLPGMGCNDVGEDPEIAEAVILVTGITFAGTSAAAVTQDVVATIEFKVEDRTGTGKFFVNSVTFTNFTVTFLPPWGIFDGVGIANSVSFLVGSSGNKLILDLIPAGAKPPAGSVLIAGVSFDGADLNGRTVTLDATVNFAITP